MITTEGIYKLIWKELTHNAELMQLLDIVPYTGSYPPLPEEVTAWNTFIGSCKRQIFEGQNSDDALTDTKTKIQITEGKTNVTDSDSVVSKETTYVYLYSWVTKENNRNNRKSLKIADELVKSIDWKERQRQGLLPISVGVGYLAKCGKDPFARVDARGWDCYGVIFKASYIA